MAVEAHLHQIRDHQTARTSHAQPSMMAPVYHPIVQLQHTVGNRAISRLVAQGRVHPKSGHIMRQDTGEEAPAEEVPLQPLTEVRGEVQATGPDETDFGRVLHLQGRTTASFSNSSNSFASENTSLTRGSGCSGCGDSDPCVNVSTTIVCTYSVPISVSLPDLSTMDLTDCERQQAQNWIDTVLSPHEQQHVAAFRTYNGTTRRPLNFSACRSAAQTELDTRAQAMMTSEQVTRQASAQAASDALDNPPFNMDFEVNCPTQSQSDAGTGDAGTGDAGR
jgi:hypothetical protein